MSRSSLSFWFIIVPDALLFYAGLWLTIVLRYQDTLGHALVSTFTYLFLLWMVNFFIHGLFETRVFRRYTTLLFSLISAFAVNFFVAILYFYFQPNLILTPRRFLLLDIAITFVLILAWYLLIKYFFQKKLVEGVYLVEANGDVEELEKEIINHGYLGYHILGRLGQQTLADAKLEKNSSVILPDNLHSSSQLSEQLYQLRTHGVTFYNYKDFYENLLRRIYLSDLSEIWFLENVNYQEKRLYTIVKRMVDLVSGVVVLAVFGVTYPIIALLIKLESKGPSLFTQDRIGKDGKTFKIYKYRTMDKATYTTWTAVNDSRITKIGKILRKTRLDELPQSINLIRGDVSLVGPRPEQPSIVEELRRQIPFYDERHLVKPGLTGWAVINNIYAGNLDETKLKLQYDLYYIKHRGFLFDLEIILKTVYYIFTWQGR